MENRFASISDLSAIIPADNCDDLYLSLFNCMYDGVCLFEICGRKIKALYLSERYFDIIGYTKEQYLPYYDNITVTLFEEDEERIFKSAVKCIKDKTDFYCEVRGYRYDGSVGWFCIRARSCDYVKCDNPVFIASINDISEQKVIEQELTINRERYRIFEETSGAYLFDYNCVQDIMTFTPHKDQKNIVINNYCSYLRRSGRILDEDVMYFTNVFFKACRKEMKGHLDVRTFNSEKNEYDKCRVYYSSIADKYGYILRVVGRLELIEGNEGFSARFAADREANSVSGLQDSSTAIELIKKKIASGGKRFFMAVADIDDLTEYNRQFGAKAADDAIKMTAELIKNIFGENAVIFRYIGDEFIIFAEDLTETEMHELFEKLRVACRTTVINNAPDSSFSVSMGGAWTSNDEKANVTDYFITADRALFKAKTEGKDKLYIEKIIY